MGLLNMARIARETALISYVMYSKYMAAYKEWLTDAKNFRIKHKL